VIGKQWTEILGGREGRRPETHATAMTHECVIRIFNEQLVVPLRR
jgi:hypothetical protein